MTMRRLCNTKMKVIKRQCFKIVVITISALLYNEFLVYYLVLLSCSYPEPPGSVVTSVPVMAVADTHLLGSRLGHWADKLRREWQMHRTFQTAKTLFAPKHVFFLGKNSFHSKSFFDVLCCLGDLFDEGKWCPPAEFEYYVARFWSLFKVDSSKTRVHVMAGNHDIGFHYAVNPHLDSRFREAFKTKAVQLSVLEKTIPIVRINSMAFEGDSCFLCKEAKKNLETVKNKLKVHLSNFN